MQQENNINIHIVYYIIRVTNKCALIFNKFCNDKG